MWPFTRAAAPPPEPLALRHSFGPLLAQVRGRVVAILTDVNGTTERETLAAGSSLAEIVRFGREHIEHLRALLDRKVGGSGADLTRAVRVQGERIHLHLAGVTTALDRHREEVALAVAHAEQIATAASAIARLTSEARSLALNARIEAARAGEHARGFSVIAEQMKRLSEAIAGANATINQLSKSLGKALPSLQVHSTQLGEATATLAADLRADQLALEQDVDLLRAGVADALADSDRAIDQMVASSHAALSHLQFQDVCAQKLLSIDSRLHALHLEAGGAADDVPPPVQQVLGSFDDGPARSAGNVVLF